MPQQLITRQDPADEAALVRGLQERKPEAIATFVDRSHGAVFSLACRLSADPDLRQDWTHAVLLRLIEDMGRGMFVYRRAGSFWAWFRKRAYYLMLNHLNEYRTRGQREQADLDPDATIASLAARSGSSPDEELERAEIRRLMEEGLASIENHEQRRALWLLLDQELSYQEIAESMAAELNTVRSWIRRGRIAMRLFLAAKMDFDDLDEAVA